MKKRVEAEKGYSMSEAGWVGRRLQTLEKLRKTLAKFNRLNTLPWWLSGKESAHNVGDMGSIPRLERSSGEGNGNTPIFLPGESHGQRNLVGCSPWRGSQRVGHDWACMRACMRARTHTHTHARAPWLTLAAVTSQYLRAGPSPRESQRRAARAGPSTSKRPAAPHTKYPHRRHNVILHEPWCHLGKDQRNREEWGRCSNSFK